MGENSESESLNQLYNEIQKVYHQLEESSLSSTSQEYQNIVHNGVRRCEKIIRMVNMLALFGNNEDLDELSSDSIKYMIAPAMMAYFVEKSSRIPRCEAVENAIKFYDDFLTICHNYKASPAAATYKPQKADSVTSTDTVLLLRSAMTDREEKVNRLKALKSTEVRVKELEKYVQQEHVDEEVKRKYYLSVVERWALVACQELDLLAREAQMLKMATNPPPVRPVPSAVSRPFLLTRSALQSKVFGAGYPSLPTYTIDEWYESQFGLLEKDGTPVHGIDSCCGDIAHAIKGGEDTTDYEEQRKVKDEIAEETEDATALKKKRDWDEFKDDNPRGAGNRANKG